MSEKHSLDRINALSDGIFAICLTLLVLDLQTPELTEPNRADLIAQLLQMLPRVEVWAVSFMVIGQLWNVQRRLIGRQVATDSVVLTGNLIFLLLVSLLPFSVDVLGSFPSLVVSIQLFYAHIAVIGLVLFLVVARQLSLGKSCLHPAFHCEKARRLALYRASVIFFVSLLCVGLSFVHSRLALWGWLMIPILIGLLQDQEHSKIAF